MGGAPLRLVRILTQKNDVSRGNRDEMQGQGSSCLHPRLRVARPGHGCVFMAMLAAGLALLVCPVSAAQTQTPLDDLLAGSHGQEAEPNEPAPRELTANELEESIQRDRERLRNAESSLKADALVQLGAEPEEANEWVRLLGALVRIQEKHLGALERIEQIRDAAQALSDEREAWAGFPDKESVTFDFVDSLRDDAHASEVQIEALQAEKGIAERMSASNASYLSQTQQALRQAQEKVDTATDNESLPRFRWLAELAALRVEAAQAEQKYLDAQIRALDKAMLLEQAQHDFLQRKLDVATGLAPFTRQALEQKLESVSDRTEELEKEYRQAAVEEEAAQAAVRKARTALEEARQKAAAEDGEGQPPGLARLQATLDAREAEAETARVRLEALDVLQDLAAAQKLIWEQRFGTSALVPEEHGNGLEDIRPAMDLIDVHMKRIGTWRDSFESKRKLTRTLLQNQQQHLADLPADAETRPMAAAERDTYLERETAVNRTLAALDDLERLLKRWQEELEESVQEATWADRVSSIASTAWRGVKKAWDTELFQVGDTGVTVSKIVFALVILFAGFVLARRTARRIRRVVVARFQVGDDVAEPAEKAVFYVLLILVVLFALSAVRIPLTVFAYLGGALAIGVGFGAQNLINNFISGLIMLLERPIKIGDIIEVEGIYGTVRGVGARCSQVRRFDGIDMLIPNSSFLEKNVVNWTLSDKQIRFPVTVGVAYGSPTREVERLIRQAVDEQPLVLREPATVILFEEFGDSALIFTAYVWIEVTAMMDARVVRSDLRYRIDELFRETGITIAFPQRDVHLDTLSPLRVELTRPTRDSAPPEE